MKLTDELAKTLWINARDSIRHALEHFSELSLSREDKYHHKKWIVLSVHHCAEIFSCVLLKELDPNNPAFPKKGKKNYPGLNKVVKVLLHPNFKNHIRESEKNLLKLFYTINGSRNKIMHGEMLENLDVSISAMVLIGISHVSESRWGESAEDIIEASFPILRDVTEAIRANKLKEDTKLIEAFVRERYPNGNTQDCLWCGAYAVTREHYPIRCEACFEEYDEKECSNCNEENLIFKDDPDIQHCFNCKNRIHP